MLYLTKRTVVEVAEIMVSMYYSPVQSNIDVCSAKPMEQSIIILATTIFKRENQKEHKRRGKLIEGSKAGRLIDSLVVCDLEHRRRVAAPNMFHNFTCNPNHALG